MVRNLLSSLVAAGFIASMSLSATATVAPGHTITSNATINATVVASCNITSNGTMNFADYLPSGVPQNSTSADLARTSDAGSADATMQCTANTPYSVTVPSTSRNMTGLAHGDTIQYTYNVLGTFQKHTDPHGNITCPIPTNANTASGMTDSAADPVDIEFEGCINPGKWPTPDHYQDVFTFIVSF